MSDIIIASWQITRISNNYFRAYKPGYYQMTVYCDNLYQVEIKECYNIPYRLGHQMIGDGCNHSKILGTLYNILENDIVPVLKRRNWMDRHNSIRVGRWYASKVGQHLLKVDDGKYIVLVDVDAENQITRISNVDVVEMNHVRMLDRRENSALYHSIEIAAKVVADQLVVKGWFVNESSKLMAQDEQKEEERIMLRGKLVSVSFTSTRNDQGGFGASCNETLYHYQNPLGLDLKQDDIVLVETKYGFSSAYVVNPDMTTTEVCDAMHVREVKVLSNIVAKIDLSEWDTFQKKEERRKQIMQEVKQAKAKMDDIQMLEALVKTMPEMQTLLDEYKTLIKEDKLVKTMPEMQTLLDEYKTLIKEDK